MSALGQRSAFRMCRTCTMSALGTLCKCTHALACAYTHTHTDVTSPPRADPNFLTHFTTKGGPSIFEWSTLSMACEVLTTMYMILTSSGLLFMAKMIQEIISMPRADSGYPIILWSIPEFSKITRPNLRLKPTPDLKCVRSWLKVRTSHV